MVLTQKQKDELNKAIIEYCYNNDYEDVAQKFEEVLDFKFDKNEQKNPMLQNILEKKWTTFSRLYAKDRENKQEIQDLKQEIQELKEKGVGASNGNGLQLGAGGGASKNDFYIPKVKHTLSSHRANITRVAFHKQYSWCASSSEDGSVKVWDTESAELEATLKQHSGFVNSVSFDYSGKLLLTASSDTTLKIWDLQQFVCIKTLQDHDHSVSHGEFSIDNNYILSSSRDKTIKLWEVNTGYCKKTLEGHADWVRMVKYSPNGQKFASCSNDESIIIWDTTKMEPIHHIEGAHDNVIEVVAWCGQNLDKSEIISGESNDQQQKSQEDINGDNNKEEENKQKINGQQQKNSNNQQQQDSSSNNIFLASGGRDKMIKLWNTVKGECVFTFRGTDNWVRGICFHRYLNYMYTSSDDKSIRIWNLNTGKQVKKIHDAHAHFVSCIDVAHNYMLLASGGSDFKLKIWDLKM